MASPNRHWLKRTSKVAHPHAGHQAQYRQFYRHCGRPGAVHSQSLSRVNCADFPVKDLLEVRPNRDLEVAASAARLHRRMCRVRLCGKR